MILTLFRKTLLLLAAPTMLVFSSLASAAEPAIKVGDTILAECTRGSFYEAKIEAIRSDVHARDNGFDGYMILNFSAARLGQYVSVQQICGGKLDLNRILPLQKVEAYSPGWFTRFGVGDGLNFAVGDHVMGFCGVSQEAEIVTLTANGYARLKFSTDAGNIICGDKYIPVGRMRGNKLNK